MQDQPTQVQDAPIDAYQPDPLTEVGAPAPIQGLPQRPSRSERHQQAFNQLDEQNRQQWEKDQPFMPSGWQDKTDPRQYIQAARQSDQLAAEQAAQDRAALTEQRRAQIAQIKARNAQAQANAHSTGQQTYVDPYGQVQPVLEAGTNRPLYHPTPWQLGEHPKTKAPVLWQYDRYRQRQFKDPKVFPNYEDPLDNQLYFQTPDGGREPVGTIDQLIHHPNFQIARTAMAANRRLKVVQNKINEEPVKAEADAAAIAIDNAKKRKIELEVEIKKLTDEAAEYTDKMMGETRGGVLGIGGEPTPSATKAIANRDSAISKIKQKLEEQLALEDAMKPGTGALWQQHRTAVNNLAMFKAKARQEEDYAANLYNNHVAQGAFNDYTAQANARRAILKSKGMAESGDPVLDAAIAGQKAFGDKLAQLKATVGEQPSTQPGMQQQETAQPAAPTGDMEQSEPFALYARGIKNVGGVSIQEIAKRYGSGQGPVEPGSLLKIKQRTNDLQATLDNKDTNVAPKLRDSMSKEKEYLDALFTQRYARLAPEDQKRVADIIDAQTVSKSGTIARTALSSAPGIGGAIAGGKVGAIAGTVIGSPVGGVVGALIGALGGSIFADKGSRALAQKVAPEAYAKFESQSAQDWEQNTATVAGTQFAANLAAFKPALSVFKNKAQNVMAFKGLYNLAARKPLSEAETQAVKALAVQAGLAGGSSVAMPLIEGQKLDPMQVLAGAAQMFFFGEHRGGGKGKPAEAPKPAAERQMSAAERVAAEETGPIGEVQGPPNLPEEKGGFGSERQSQGQAPAQTTAPAEVHSDFPTQQEAHPNATQTRQQPENNIVQRQGTPQGEDLRQNIGEVWPQKSPTAVGGNSVGSSSQVGQEAALPVPKTVAGETPTQATVPQQPTVQSTPAPSPKVRFDTVHEESGKPVRLDMTPEELVSNFKDQPAKAQEMLTKAKERLTKHSDILAAVRNCLAGK
jgi:hypothetical protein